MKSRRMSGGLAPLILEGSGEPHSLVALFLGRVLPVTIEREAGRAREMGWAFRGKLESSFFSYCENDNWSRHMSVRYVRCVS